MHKKKTLEYERYGIIGDMGDNGVITEIMNDNRMIMGNGVKTEIMGDNKKSANTWDCIHTSKRWLADSNRRKRFCRPVTKPLIQTTKRTRCFEFVCKVTTFFLTSK